MLVAVVYLVHHWFDPVPTPQGEGNFRQELEDTLDVVGALEKELARRDKLTKYALERIGITTGANPDNDDLEKLAQTAIEQHERLEAYR